MDSLKSSTRHLGVTLKCLLCKYGSKRPALGSFSKKLICRCFVFLFVVVVFLGGEIIFYQVFKSVPDSKDI